MANNLTYNKSAFRRVKNQVKKADIDMLRLGIKVGNVVQRHIRKQFATKGAWMGTPWKPLAKSTIKQKRELGFGNRILVRTGDMKAGLTKSPMNIEWYTNTTGVYGSAEQRAIWQHFGTRRNGRRHIPPRTLLKVTPLLKADIIALLRKQSLGIRR